jgi:hypothetical protein
MCLLVTTSCNSFFNNTSDFKEVDFTNGQKIQLVMGEEVYNLFISFNENGEFTLKYLPEASEILKNITVTIKGDNAEISSAELEFSKNINEFNNSFAPKIIYMFLKNTDFKTENFVFDNSENSKSLTKNILEKTVDFTVTLTNDKQSQIYLLKIR